MELEVKINATAKEVFDELVKSIQQDIKNSTGDNVIVNELVENYSYRKKLMTFGGKDAGVLVNIEKLIPPTKYSATITNAKGVNSIEYNLSDCEDGVKIMYKESYTSNSILQRANSFIMGFLYTKSNKKKMIRNFSYLEQQILAQRDNLN